MRLGVGIGLYTMTFYEAVAWEASFQVWHRGAMERDTPRFRRIWTEAPLTKRIQQAEEWLNFYPHHPRHAQDFLAAATEKTNMDLGWCEVCEAQPATQRARFVEARICAACAEGEPEPAP